MRLRPKWIDEGIDLVVATLGEEWLRAECARRQPTMHQLDHGHEIVNAFTMGGGASVVLVLELALYLRRLASCPGFDDVVAQLHSDFTSTLLQLAYAYRIHLRGPQVILEPPARDGRKGDIAFRWSGRPYQVECYARQRRPDVLKDFFSYSIGRILGDESCRTRALRIVVRFHRVPSDADRLAIERRVCAMSASVQPGTPLRFADESVFIAVRDIEGEPETDFLPDGLPNDAGPHRGADALICGGEVPIDWVEGTSPTPRLLRTHGLTRLILYRPPTKLHTEQERVTELADRIERKLAQTRAPGAVARRRLIIAQLERGRERETRHKALCRALANRIVHRHDDVVAVLLCSRVWTAEHRYRYVGTIITDGASSDPLPAAISRWAIDTDYGRDVLSGW